MEKLPLSQDVDLKVKPGKRKSYCNFVTRQGAKVIGTDLNYKAAKNTQDFILKENNKCGNS